MSDAFQLTKAQITQQRKMMKSDAAQKYRKKRQKERAGVGNGFYKLQARAPNGEEPGTVKKADGQIRTIHDMIDYYYGFVPEYMNKGGMSKQSDDPVLSTTNGYNNAVFGSEVFMNINHEANAFALLENRAWTKSGERTITEFGHGVASGGSPENATLDETDHPNIEQYEQEAKTVQHTFDVSQVEELLSETQDDNLDDPFDYLRRYYGTGTEQMTGMGEHPKHLNEQLLQAVDDAGDPNNFLSIDQLISNQNEAQFISNTSNANVYGFDRSSGEFQSNVVDNNGDLQTFTIDLLDTAVREVREGSGKDPVADDNYFFLTGHDTYERIEDEVGGKERLENQRVGIGLNGVETVPGQDVGITVSAYKDIPIFRSNDVPKDDISRVYLVDSSTLFIKTLLPTQFYSSGTEVNDDPFSIGRLGNEGLYVTIGETTTTSPISHAKVRDLA